jgi:hypothetical protein
MSPGKEHNMHKQITNLDDLEEDVLSDLMLRENFPLQINSFLNSETK